VDGWRRDPGRRLPGVSSTHVLVLAKEPRPGRVKTRLCPPCSPEEAATVAAAALADTLEAVAASGADRHILALDGRPGPWLPPGFEVVESDADSLRTTGGDQLTNLLFDFSLASPRLPSAVHRQEYIKHTAQREQAASISANRC